MPHTGGGGRGRRRRRTRRRRRRRRRMRRRHYTCMFLKFSVPWEWNAAGFDCILTKCIREVVGHRTDCLDWGVSAFSLRFQRWYSRGFPVNHSQPYCHTALYILCTWVSEKISLHGIQFRNPRSRDIPHTCLMCWPITIHL
jgi:hypothetical protein